MAFRKLKAESKERSFQQDERQRERAAGDLKIETCVVAGNVLNSLKETLRQAAALGYENMPCGTRLFLSGFLSQKRSAVKFST